MDRRRFVPSTEGLEDRALQASLFGTSSVTNLNTVVDLPNTPQQKALRIERLPFFLKNFQPTRFLTKEIMAPIQADLTAIEGQLHSPPSAVLDQFNHTVRAVIPDQTLSSAAARQLNSVFGVVLHNAGATPKAEASFKADMNNLARVDSQDVNPVILATNDYSTIIQTALGVGRPIRTPAAPVIAPVDSVGPKGTQITNVRQPRLVGTYEVGATMQIVNNKGQILGSGVVAANGKYVAQFSISLSNGTHTVFMQAVDSGFTSPISPPFTFKVVSGKVPKVQVATTHPQGPLATTGK
ncbi:MAG TPA: Ig-like domain-containing protein [Isosphaeraceae bacterium]|jgi:hypothetical protein|nr:Ig-like domain-containing protein [Isosphaeraceae bacterium]